MNIFIPYYISKKNRINKLALSGGSTKGISYIGVLKAMEEYEIINKIKTFSGTSVGGIVCFLIVIGYSSKELRDEIMQLDIKSLFKMGEFNYGFDNGSRIVDMIKKLMKNKNIKYDITFEELFKLTNKRLIIAATNLSEKRIEYFDYKRSPDMNVLIAIRMSMSVPILFSPIIYNGCYYVDGGLINNLPNNIFKHPDKVMSINIESKIKIDCVEKYLFALVDLISCQESNATLELNIDINVADFNIDDENKDKLMNYGYNIFSEWIKCR